MLKLSRRRTIHGPCADSRDVSLADAMTRALVIAAREDLAIAPRAREVLAYTIPLQTGPGSERFEHIALAATNWVPGTHADVGQADQLPF